MVTIANFSINFLQYITPNGELKADLPEFCKDKDVLIYLYTTMVRTRVFDEKTVKLQRTGKLGTYASSLGQEAVFVGYGSAMQDNDVLVPYYRDYGAMLQRGVTMVDILRYWGGDERGSYFDPNGISKEDFPISVPIASQCLHATGVAKAIQYRKQQRAVVTTCGEGGTSEGDFYEAINLAGDWKLPVVFIVNNNQWAISVPRDAQTGCQTIAQKAIAAGFDGIQVDGNDVIAVKQAATEALNKARNGGGPTLIEAITYRLCDHTTADDASRYHDQKQFDKAWQEEPFIRLRNYMIENNFWDDEKEQSLLKNTKAEVDKAVKTYLDTPAPELSDIFDYLYDTLPPDIAAQRDSLLEEEK